MLGWLHLESGMRKEAAEEEDASTAWLGFLKKGSLEIYVSEGNRYLHNSIILYLKEGQLNFVDRFKCSWLFTNSHHEFLELF